MEGSSLIPNTTIEEDGSYLVITINGDALNSVTMPTTELNITIVANDGFSDSDACIAVVSIEYLPTAECVTVRTTEQQNTELAERQINAIYIPVQESPSQVKRILCVDYNYYYYEVFRHRAHSMMFILVG